MRRLGNTIWPRTNMNQTAPLEASFQATQPETPSNFSNQSWSAVRKTIWVRLSFKSKRSSLRTCVSETAMKRKTCTWSCQASHWSTAKIKFTASALPWSPQKHLVSGSRQCLGRMRRSDNFSTWLCTVPYYVIKKDRLSWLWFGHGATLLCCRLTTIGFKLRCASPTKMGRDKETVPFSRICSDTKLWSNRRLLTQIAWANQAPAK